MKSTAVIWTLVRVIAAVSLAIWCVLRLRALDHYSNFSPLHFVRIPGIIMLVLGAGLVLWCGGILSDVGIFEKPDDRLFPLEFVAKGPFRYVRNPMSLGGILVFAGLGLYLRSISILLFSLLLFLLLHLVAVFFEEPGLEKRFGQSYLEYKRTVGRWVPRAK